MEAAAIGWWEEWNRALAKLPTVDPNPLLKRATPGSAAAAAYVVAIEKLATDEVTASPPTINQIRIDAARFTSATNAIVTTCTADDSSLTKNSQIFESGLTRLQVELGFTRVDNQWLLVSSRTIRPYERGKSCDDPFSA